MPLLIVALLALAGCAPAPPAERSDIRGRVSGVDASAQRVSMLIERPADDGRAYDKAFVTADENTKVLRPTGRGWRRATLAELARAKRVDVWFAGPVAESYPVQATAGTIAILE